SRALAEGVVTELGLRLSIVDPRISRRSDLIRDVKVSDSATSADYSLVHQDAGRFVLLKDSAETRHDSVGTVEVGKKFEGAGFSFVLAPGAEQQSRIRFNIRSLTSVASGIA